MLYTEMVASNAILHNKSKKLNKLEHLNDEPVGFQLGGDNPKQMAECAKIIESYGYNEINLNIGCPSKRAQSGNFGACLFSQPNLVASCVHEMSKVTKLPITIKTRLGIDNLDNIKHLKDFINIISNEGVNTFHLHARKAILKKGVNPRKNRSIPPINYERVYNIKQHYPELKIIINGEVNNPTDVINHLKNVDGVMIGRAVCNNPFLLNEIDILIHNEARVDKEDILKEYFKYIINNFKNDVKITDFTKHLSCIFKGYIGSKHTRAYMCHELNYEKEPVKKLEELIFKEDLWKNGQDSITTVI
jgi:tRNA-dihydrouridine synthase A|tara:strand:- start:849 stop:1760 length:912 start_codon:yes stop_codon:yes gene_type:complete